MILKKEIQQKSEQWRVPADTVDKDYVLGHYLSVFLSEVHDQLLFKGGTCLRKCYYPDYRFSEDLDFSSLSRDFVLTDEILVNTSKKLQAQTGIITVHGAIKALLSKNVPKGFQVKIKYWGANHNQSQSPPPPEKWHTSIKLEISTDELVLLSNHLLKIQHDYSDSLTGVERVQCYDLREIVSEKLRSLVQRSYTAPRDFFDIYHLTKDFTGPQWDEAKDLFFKKMQHKQLVFIGPDQLVDQESLEKVRKAWQTSLNHQMYESIDADTVISYVYETIHKIF